MTLSRLELAGVGGGEEGGGDGDGAVGCPWGSRMG